MKKLLFIFAMTTAASFASCGGNTGSGMSAADSIRLEDSLNALQQAEQEAIQEAEKAAIQAAEEASREAARK